MTELQLTPEPTLFNPPAWTVLYVTRDPGCQVEVAAELPPVALAQRAGDALYAWTLEHTGDSEQAAVDYHLEFQTVARELGCGPVCNCDLCCEEFGQVSAE